MGFKFIELQTLAPGDLGAKATSEHHIGALLIFMGAWLCWEALVISRDAWWRDPKHYAQFAKQFRKTNSWVVFIENHPATVSEMIGDRRAAQGAITIAMCLPACMLTLAGGFMLYQGWPSGADADPMLSTLANGMRGCLMPIGYTIVLLTPVITLDRFEYGITPDGSPWKRQVSRSEAEELWHAEHHLVHGIGFVFGIVLGILWEGSFLCIDVAWYFLDSYSTSLPWPAPARITWCVLTALRGVALVLQVYCLVCFVMFQDNRLTLADDRLVKFKKWMLEYSCLCLSGLVMMYNAVSVYVFAGHGPRSSRDWFSLLWVIILTGMILRMTMGFFGIGDVRWAGVAALVNFSKVDWETVLHYILAVRCCPSLLLAIKAKAGAELMGIDIAQAGDTDRFTVLWHDLGKNLPKLQALIVCPGLIDEVKAINFDDLSDTDLLLFHEDLASTLKVLPSTDIMLVPFGSRYKLHRRMPIAMLMPSDYGGDLARVRDSVAEAIPTLPAAWSWLANMGAALGFCREGLHINSAPYWSWRTQYFASIGFEEVARDITDAVQARLSDRLSEETLRQDLVTLFEGGADLRPLYKLLRTELAALKEYEVQFRGLVGGPPQLVAVALKEYADKADFCSLWAEGREVLITDWGNATDGKLYHKLD